MSQLLRAGEVGYAVVALFALTQGPIYRLWSESSTYLGTSPRPSMPHIYFATFVSIQLPALILLSRRLNTRILHDRSIQFLGAFILWMILTVFWSSLARHSLPEVVSLVLTTTFGVYIAQSFTLKQFWKLVLAAMSLGILMSLFAIQRNWDSAISPEAGYWIGIYYNRNSFAPVAAVTVVAALGVFLSQKTWRDVRGAPTVVSTGVMAVLAVAVLWRAESRTSPMALSLAFGSLVLWLVLQRVSERFQPCLRTWVSVLSMSVSAVVVFFVLRTASEGTSVTPGTATFNLRGGLWAQNWSGILEKPWFGWGWMAARRTPTFFADVWWFGFPTEWSHNGYHDILLGGGVVAGFLFAGFLIFALRRTQSSTSLVHLTPLYLGIVFVLAAATQESFFIGTHFMWAILVAMLLQYSRNSVDEKYASHGT